MCCIGAVWLDAEGPNKCTNASLRGRVRHKKTAGFAGRPAANPAAIFLNFDMFMS